MKTLRILFIVLFAIGMVNCKKDIQEDVEQMAEIEFAIDHVEPLMPKNTNPDIICQNDLVPVKAVIKIQGIDDPFMPEVFFVDGKAYTQSIKLPAANPNGTVYTVTYFALLNAANQVIMATPSAGSAYAEYVNGNTVNFNFTVLPFKKAQFKVWVLCYDEINYQSFGFTWFWMNRIVVRNFCFFGDFCMKDVGEYLGSAYSSQFGATTQGYFDAIALMQIDVYKKLSTENTYTFVKMFTNVGENINIHEPLCVQFADNLDKVENFRFDLKILVKVGNSYEYIKFHEFTSTDGGPLSTPVGSDGVLDFVLGSCNHTFTDLVLPPYQNLPVTASLSITHNYSQGGYWTLSIAGGATGFDFPSSGDYIGWCGDVNTTIGTGSHIFNIYSSLNQFFRPWPAGVPAHFTMERIAKVNWLLNNIHTLGLGYPKLTGMFMTPANFGSLVNDQQAKDLQHAIWMLLGQPGPWPGVTGGGTASTAAISMFNSADGKGNYVPLPGGYAAVLLHKGSAFQLIFIIVDP